MEYSDGFIKEVWGIYKQNYINFKNTGYGLTHEQAERIVEYPEWAYFFEGQCIKLLGLDPKEKYLNSQDKQKLIREIAIDLIQNKELRKQLHRLWKTEHFIPSQDGIV